MTWPVGGEAHLTRIMIADDDPSLRMLVAATLASEDYEILEAGSGLEALAVARSARPKVVLLDFHMPEMDGFEVCRSLRTDPALALIRVILLTSANHPEERAAGLAAGADAYLTKPFSPIELLQAVGALSQLPSTRPAPRPGAL
ncbi:MAG: response regulator receiver protein [Chloroflexi bacterium]|nr:response regulator receiver protein [Chloroflexota bacterium]